MRKKFHKPDVGVAKLYIFRMSDKAKYVLNEFSRRFCDIARPDFTKCYRLCGDEH
jgi:hypothetical protein